MFKITVKFNDQHRQDKTFLSNRMPTISYWDIDGQYVYLFYKVDEPNPPVVEYVKQVKEIIITQPDAPPSVSEQVKSILAEVTHQNKIQQIKKIRELTGLGLVESKVLVDNAYDKLSKKELPFDQEEKARASRYCVMGEELYNQFLELNNSALTYLLGNKGFLKISPIQAIKEICAHTGCGLKEAKEVMEYARDYT